MGLGLRVFSVVGVPEFQPLRRLRSGGSGAGPRRRGCAGAVGLRVRLSAGAGSVLKRRTGLFCAGPPVPRGGRGAGGPTVRDVGASGLDSSGPADRTSDVWTRAVLRRSLPGTTLHPPPRGRAVPVPEVGTVPPGGRDGPGPYRVGPRRGETARPGAGSGHSAVRWGTDASGPVRGSTAGSGHTPARWETDGASPHRVGPRRGETAVRRRRRARSSGGEDGAGFAGEAVIDDDDLQPRGPQGSETARGFPPQRIR